MEELVTSSDSKPKRNKRGQLLPGQPSLNPKGRPEGQSIKDRVRIYLNEHPDDMEAFVKHFATNNKELAWQMLEGRPSQGLGQADDLDPMPLLGGASVPIKEDVNG